MFVNRPWRGSGIGVGNVYQKPIGHNSSAAKEIEISIPYGFAVCLKIKHTPLIRRQRSKTGTEKLLVVVIPLLEMMRREEHSLVPHTFSIPGHKLVGSSAFNRRLGHRRRARC